MRRVCAVAFVAILAASCCSQVNSPFTTYRHITDHNMSTMSAVHCSSVVLVGPGSKIVFGDGTVQVSAAGGGVNAMQNPSTGTLNMAEFGIDRLAFIQAATTYGGQKISFSNSPSGIFFDERLMPDTDGSIDMGAPTFQWRHIYASSLSAGGISIDGLVYPRDAYHALFNVIGSNFYLRHPYINGRLYIGSTTDGVHILGPLYLGYLFPSGSGAYIGTSSEPFDRIYVSKILSDFFTVLSTGTRVYGTFVSTHQVIADADGVPRFVVHYSTFESSLNNGMLISTGGALVSGVRGMFIDAGTDNPDYAGNIIVGELDANNFIRPTQGRLNVKGALYVTSGYAGEFFRFSNSSSGNYMQAGDAGLVLQCDDAVVFRGNNDGTVYLSTSITGSGSYSLLRINTSNGRVYYDTSSRRNKRNIRPWSPSSGTLQGLTVRRFTETTTGRESFGLIAEELDAAGVKDLVVYDDHGKIVGVAYEKVALVLIPVLQEQQARIERLERAVAALSSGTFAAEFPEGFPVGKPATEQGGNALKLLTVLAALLMGGVGVYVVRKVK